MLFSVEQAFVGREEIRAPLKTPAWEATLFSARSRIFLPIAQSCAALFCCRLAIRASSLGWLVGNDLRHSNDDWYCPS